VPDVIAAAAACGLLVGYPDAAVGGAGLGSFEREGVGGWRGGNVVEVICEECFGKGCGDSGEIELGG
jgi:hypothetical protein